MAFCKSCHASIRWMKTPTGASMPVDPMPDSAGNLAIVGPNECRVLSADEITEMRDVGAALYMPHWASCPNSKSHKRA